MGVKMYPEYNVHISLLTLRYVGPNFFLHKVFEFISNYAVNVSRFDQILDIYMVIADLLE